MKKLSIYLFLVLFSFQTSSLGSDISDVQIEGISIGDSLLDYYSEKEIKDNVLKDTYNKNKKYTVTGFFDSTNTSKIYDGFYFYYKTYDKNYIIHSISAFIDYDTYIYNCHKKVNKLDKELSAILNDAKRRRDTSKHPADKSGKSTIKRIFYDLKSGGGASISCTNWSSKMDYPDGLLVILDSKEFRQWWSPTGCGSGSSYC